MKKATAKQIKTPLMGEIRIVGDKSISHRALMLSSLAKDTTEISGLLESEDVLATLKAMQNLGAKISKENDTYLVTGGDIKSPKEKLYLGNSGTSARLIAGIIASHEIKAVITGDNSLSKRPMQRIITPLSQMGAEFKQLTENSLPLEINGVKKTKSIRYEMPVASAQLKSAILLAGLNSHGTTTIIEPRKSRDHTELMLGGFEVEVNSHLNSDNSNEVTIKGGQKLISPKKIIVPADPSSAAFFAAATLIYPKSHLILKNICINPTRIGFYEILQKMGANIKFINKRKICGENIADIEVKYTENLNAVNIDKSFVPKMIDEYPIMAIVASMANGTSIMEDLAELRVKESNRLEKIAEGLNLNGVQAKIAGDDLIIHGTNNSAPEGGGFIKTGFDHRIAMSFLVLGGITKKPISIDNAEAIKTSFPEFIPQMNKIGGNIIFS